MEPCAVSKKFTYVLEHTAASNRLLQQHSVFHLEDVSGTLLRNIRAFRHIPEDSNLHIHTHDDLKPTTQLTDLPTNQNEEHNFHSVHTTLLANKLLTPLSNMFRLYTKAIAIIKVYRHTSNFAPHNNSMW